VLWLWGRWQLCLPYPPSRNLPLQTVLVPLPRQPLIPLHGGGALACHGGGPFSPFLGGLFHLFFFKGPKQGCPVRGTEKREEERGRGKGIRLPKRDIEEKLGGDKGRTVEAPNEFWTKEAVLGEGYKGLI